MIKSRQQERAC